MTRDQYLQAVYKERDRLTLETGIQHHVDHIIPLHGRLVSGLHVETNLQILTFDQNRKKWNNFEPQDFVRATSDRPKGSPRPEQTDTFIADADQVSVSDL